MSVTFVSLRTGWALGDAPCARSNECLALRETLDGGRTWAARLLPAALADAADREPGGGLALNVSGCCGEELNVRFADRRDGWIYGGLFVPGQFPSTVSIEPVLWSTHNGGLSWRTVRPFPALAAESPIFDVEAAAGHVYAMVDATAVNGSYGAMIESSPVASDSWRAASSLTLSGPGGGSQPFGAIVLQGKSGWAVYGNGRGTSGSAQLNGQGAVGGLVPSVRLGRAQLRRAGCLDGGQPGRGMRDRRFRGLCGDRERAEGGDLWVDVALFL